MASDFAGAIDHAGRALAAAEQSGHLRTHASAVANRGLAHLALGELAEAEKDLERAFELGGVFEVIRIPLLESLAQLRLAQHRWTDCEALLGQITERVPKDGSFRPSWYELIFFETRIKLSLRRGDPDAAYEMATAAVAMAMTRKHRLLEVLFLTLKADAALMLGRHAEAGQLVIKASESSTGASLATLAEIERVKGKLLATLGNHAEAAVRFERALRVLDTSQHARLLSDVQADYRTIVPGWADRASSPAVAQGSAQPAAQTETPAARFEAGMARALQAAATLVGFADQPELVGHEAFLALRESRCANGLALVRVRPDRPPEVLAATGWDATTALELAESPAAVEIGQADGLAVRLLVEPSDQLLCRETVAAIKALVTAADSIAELRAERIRRRSLWPVEPDSETSGDVWVSTETIATVSLGQRIAPTDLPVLVTGETGTGKEVLARTVHRASTRAQAPFVPFNCHAVPRDMLDSQLFGYRRGAFTGAHTEFPGVIRAAEGGTLFLDEIGELSLDVQPKLLRFLETNEIHPLGQSMPMTVDVRVIAATNVDLDRLVREGRFREDLFYRLNVFRLSLPPLRERREEVPALARHFLARYRDELGKGRLSLGDEALEYLLLYGWPGNVRQLANEMRRAAALAEVDEVITPDRLSPELRATRRTIDSVEPRVEPHAATIRTDQTLPAAIRQLERLMVSRVLTEVGGHLEHAATRLGISRKGLYLKRRQLGLA